MSSPFLHSCVLPVWTEGPSICRWLICSVYRGVGGGADLMKRTEKRLPTCHPRSLRLKPALAVKQHKCPICVCLPVDTDGRVLAWPRKFCFPPSFLQARQLTGYWEKEGGGVPMTRPLNRLAPHQPPAASNKYGPWLFKRYNRAATAKQPPAKRAPTPPPATKLPGLLFLWATAASRGPSPVLEPTLTPIGKMCVFQVSKYCHLPESSMAGPFKRGEGGCVLRPPARLAVLQQGCMWPHTATDP